MQRLLTISILGLILSFISCTTKQDTNQQQRPTTTTKPDKPKIPILGVDDYPLSNKRFRGAAQPETPVFEMDGVFFCNENQVIAYHLYTDYFRLGIFHFYNDAVPTELLKALKLRNPLSEGQTVVPKMNELHKDYFISKKGFKLGDSKEKVLDIYGPPDNQATTNKTEHLQWVFVGDQVYKPSQDLKGKPLAYNSYGHQVNMYFKDNKLVGHYLMNEIP